MSPLVSTHDLGYGFIDADIILPNNTWYGVNVLDASGQVIQGHENRTLPLSLASIDRDVHTGIYIEVMMGTGDEYYTPLIKELTVGATRYFGDANGWNIPSSLSRLSNGTWVNNGGQHKLLQEIRIVLTPNFLCNDYRQLFGCNLVIDHFRIQSVSTNMVNGVLDLGDMRTYVTPRLTFSPGAMAESLAFRGAFAQPAHDASIDLADDGVTDWQFSIISIIWSYGWQQGWMHPQLRIR